MGFTFHFYKIPEPIYQRLKVSLLLMNQYSEMKENIYQKETATLTRKKIFDFYQKSVCAYINEDNPVKVKWRSVIVNVLTFFYPLGFLSNLVCKSESQQDDEIHKILNRFHIGFIDKGRRSGIEFMKYIFHIDADLVEYFVPDWNQISETIQQTNKFEYEKSWLETNILSEIPLNPNYIYLLEV